MQALIPSTKESTRVEPEEQKQVLYANDKESRIQDMIRQKIILEGIAEMQEGLQQNRNAVLMEIKNIKNLIKNINKKINQPSFDSQKISTVVRKQNESPTQLKPCETQRKLHVDTSFIRKVNESCEDIEKQI